MKFIWLILILVFSQSLYAGLNSWICNLSDGKNHLKIKPIQLVLDLSKVTAQGTAETLLLGVTGVSGYVGCKKGEKEQLKDSFTHVCEIELDLGSDELGRAKSEARSGMVKFIKINHEKAKLIYMGTEGYGEKNGKTVEFKCF